jgi:4-amino-4-deoxy-L-arabinose transferase-like glycosyltransferase
MSAPAAPTAPPRLWLIPALIFLLALVPRLALVHQTIRQHPDGSPAGSYTDIAGDSGQYVALARNLVQYGHFADDRPDGRREGTSYFALLRPPLYPLYCALFEKFEWRPGILYAQAFLGAATAAMLAGLAGAICRSCIAAAVAGIGSALSPTGIGLAGLALADLPFATVFVAGLFALWMAASEWVPRLRYSVAVGHDRTSSDSTARATATSTKPWHPIILWYVAGALFGAACLVKPVGLYWPLLMPIVAPMLVRGDGQPARWRHIFGAAALAIAILLFWATHNRVVHGIFAVSTVDAQNLRFYLCPVVEEWAKAGEQPSNSAVRANRTKAMARDDAERRKTPAVDLVKRQWSEGLAIVRAHPRETWNAYWDNVDRQLAASFDHFDLEMPEGGFVRNAMIAIEKVTDSNGAYWLAVVLMIVPLILPWLARKERRDPSWRARAFAAPALWLTFLYLTIFVGTTTGTGSRILYPAEAPALLLIAAGVTSIVRDGTRLGKAA